MDIDESYRYHERAAARDPVVSGELWERLHVPLFRRLRGRLATLDEADVQDAITDAICRYCERPEAYHPEKLELDKYLAMAAHRDLLNLIAKRMRKTKGMIVIPFDPVEHDRPDGNTWQGTAGSSVEDSGVLPDGVAWETWMQKLREIFPTESDREVLEMMIDRVRETEKYARVIGCDHLDLEAQRKLVKQAKDRIRIRLKRFGLNADA